MPISLPNLDDRRFDDLVEEARALIPSLAPQWTNHNTSDPGITLIELFAYLSEILMYRLNRVTEANTWAFLRLLNGPAWTPTTDLQAEIRATVQALRRPGRAITPSDFVLLAHEASEDVERVGFVAGRNLALDASREAPGHISLVILPRDGGSASAALLKQVADYLEPRRLLTTRLHICAPRRVNVGLNLQLHLEADGVATEVLGRAVVALQAWFDPFIGGPEGTGWPFGRALFLSEIYRLLDALPGVDYVEPGSPAEFNGSDAQGRLIVNDLNASVGLRLAPDELPLNDAKQFALTAVSPRASR